MLLPEDYSPNALYNKDTRFFFLYPFFLFVLRIFFKKKSMFCDLCVSAFVCENYKMHGKKN